MQTLKKGIEDTFVHKKRNVRNSCFSCTKYFSRANYYVVEDERLVDPKALLVNNPSRRSVRCKLRATGLQIDTFN